MNNLTKEELKEIWERLDTYRLQCGEDEYPEFMLKIQSMIDNHFANKWVFVGSCHKTSTYGQKLIEDEILELSAMNICTKPYDTKNEMINAVIKRLIENYDE